MIHVDLTGRSALVTGAGRGIGRATADALAASGARVILVARSAEEIEAAARDIARRGGRAIAVAGDVSQPEDLARIMDRHGPVDVLVNNAGTVQPISPVASTDPVAWRRNIAVNLDGVFYACRLTLPGMVERGWGRIVNVSSGAARGSTAAWGAYSAAKAGVEALTAVMAKEVEESGVRVNAVRPGIVDTEMQVEIRGTPEEQFGLANLERFRSYKERGLLRDPGDPARLILWLLSAEADDLNGQVLAIDDPDVAARVGLVPMER